MRERSVVRCDAANVV